MRIGDYIRCLYKNPVARTLCNLFGVEDLHTHYRIRSVIDFFEESFEFGGRKKLRVLEVGCGMGLNLFELARRFPIDAEGYDLDPEHVLLAREISQKEFGNRIPFHVADARELAPSNAYDVILFVDFLEHVPQPERIVAAMDRCLKPDGVMVISVPTPRYPEVFGREMHERIGHLLDGYTVDALTELFPETYNRIETRYTTGIFGSLLCAIQCRIIGRVPQAQMRWLLSTPLLALRHLDRIGNSASKSATLFAVYRKPALEAAEPAAAGFRTAAAVSC